MTEFTTVTFTSLMESMASIPDLVSDTLGRQAHFTERQALRSRVISDLTQLGSMKSLWTDLDRQVTTRERNEVARNMLACQQALEKMLSLNSQRRLQKPELKPMMLIQHGLEVRIVMQELFHHLQQLGTRYEAQLSNDGASSASETLSSMPALYVDLDEQESGPSQPQRQGSWFSRLRKSKLREAAQRGDIQDINECLDRGVDIDSQSRGRGTAIHIAAATGQLEAVRLLIDRGAALNKADSGGNSPLHASVLAGSKAITEVLLEQRGINVDTQNAAGMTPLSQSSGEMMLVLLQNNANPNIADKNGHTPLHRCAARKDHDGARQLLDKGASVHAKDRHGRNSLWYACEKVEPTRTTDATLLVELLLNRGSTQSPSRIDPENEESEEAFPLHLAATQDLASVCERLLDSGASIEERTNLKRQTALTLAVREGHEETTRLLVDRGANVEAAASNGMTPLHLAAKGSSLAILDKLMSRIDKSRVEQLKDLDGRNPIHHVKSLAGAVALLANKGARSLSAQDAHGDTPLHRAGPANTSIYVVKELVARGASRRARDYRRQTPAVALCTYETPWRAASEVGDSEVGRLAELLGVLLGNYSGTQPDCAAAIRSWTWKPKARMQETQTAALAVVAQHSVWHQVYGMMQQGGALLDSSGRILVVLGVAGQSVGYNTLGPALVNAVLATAAGKSVSWLGNRWRRQEEDNLQGGKGKKRRA